MVANADRGGDLQEVLTVRFDQENFGVLDWWSLMGSGCTWRFDGNISKLTHSLLEILPNNAF